MSISDIGIDAVLQFDPTYLAGVIERQLAGSSTNCLETGGNTVTVGGTVVRASAVTVAYDVTGFSSGSAGVAVDVDLEVEHGTLETGSSVGSLQETSSASLSMPLSLRIDPVNSRVYELVVETGLPGTNDLGFRVLDLADIDAHGVAFDPEQNPGVVKRLSSGTIAVGLLTDARGSGWSDFQNSYDDDELDPGDDWGFVLDFSMVEAYVEQMDISEDEARLRGVDLDLDTIESGNLDLDATGEADWQGSWWSFEADVDASLELRNPQTDNSAIVVDYHVTEAKSNGLPVTNRLSSSDRNGTETFFEPAHLGVEGEPAGRLYVTGVDVQSGEVVLTGVGTRQPPKAAAVEVTPDRVTIGAGCSGNATSQTVTVSHPEGSDRQVDLAVCGLAFDGRDVGDFVADGPSTPTAIPVSSKAEYTVKTTTPQISGVSKATLKVKTSAGSETLPVRAYLDDASVSVPDNERFTGQQQAGTSCTPPSNKARTTITVSNAGPGGVEVCKPPQIVNQSGGTWNAYGLEAGEVILPASSESVTVTLRTSRAGQQETATLKLQTSAGTHTVSLSGKVTESDESQSSTVGGGIRIGPIAIDGDVLCSEPERIGEYVHVGQEIAQMIDEFLEDWEEPECGPRMLCPPFMGVSLDGFPEGTRFDLRDPAGIEAWVEPTGDDVTLVTPISDEHDLEMNIDAAEGVDTDEEVSLDVRHGRVIHEGTHRSEAPLTGVAGVRNHLAATTEDDITLFTLTDSGEPEPVTRSELEVSAKGVAAIDDLLVAHGEDGFEAFLQTGEGLERVGAGELGADVLVPDRHADRHRLAYTLWDGRLMVVDFESPAEPGQITAAETRLRGIRAGSAMGNQLALLGTDGVEGWSVAGDGGLRQRGVVELADPLAVFCDETTIYTVTDEGTLSMIGSTADGLERIGETTLTDEWGELLPRGSPTLVGKRAVTRTANGRGFNVLRPALSRFPGYDR